MVHYLTWQDTVEYMHATWRLRLKTVTRRSGILLMTVCLAGCGATHQLANGHLAYNEAVRLSSDQEILLNMVRLRYLEPMEFLSITAINSTVSFTAELDLTAGRAASDNTFSGEITATYSNSPTFSFVPQRGSDFSDRFTQPVDLQDLLFLTSAHRDVHTVFRLFVSWMNGLDNQEGLVDPGFIEVTRQLTSLQYDGLALFGFQEKDRVISPPLEASEVTPALIIQAHNAGLEVIQVADGRTLEFVVKDQQALLSIDQDSPGRHSILNTLQLSSDIVQIPIVSQREFKGNIDGKQLAVRTRSLLHTLSFLSQGIDVPADDVASGAAAWPWPHASVKPVPMGDIFQVRHSPKKPDNASLAVQFRDSWFYISDSDEVSKRTFLLVSEAFRFTLEGNAEKGPTLTLPVGGGGD